MRQISSKKWVFLVLVVPGGIYIGCLALVMVIDPYMHYRIPENGLSYALTARNQRYQNDGFIRHFNYDAIITGTSMTENFKTTEFDKMFNVDSIKVPFSGGSYKEVNGTCKRALEVHPDLKIILRSLDLSMLVKDKNSSRYNNYPEYLYNESLLDDVNYWLNKMAILEGCMQNVIFHSMASKSKESFLDSFSFDEYSSWQKYHVFGKESVLEDYVRPEKNSRKVKLTREEKDMIYDNISQNVTELASDFQNTKFLLFFTPYSICYWDSLDREGKLEWEFEAQRVAIEEILKYDNIELYSFCNNFEMVCDLNNYKDIAHYSEEVNSWMLEWICEGKYRLTKENYKDYLNEIKKFYTLYDYERIFA